MTGSRRRQPDLGEVVQILRAVGTFSKHGFRGFHSAGRWGEQPSSSVVGRILFFVRRVGTSPAGEY